MFAFLPSPLKGFLVIFFISISTIILFIPLWLLALVKLIFPLPFIKKICTALIIGISFTWININNTCFFLFHKTRWEVRGEEELKKEGWYLILSNHQSWVDILVLQKVFTGKIPFIKFFLKQELIWVPVMGLAWWALDFPFMKRYTREYLAKYPEKKGKDLEATKKACEKFRTLPVSIMNFVEGTRFTEAKSLAQKSPFKGLLRPKAAGTAFVLYAMGSQMNKIVDVCIAYPDKTPSFWEFISGKTSHIRMDIRLLTIDESLRGDYFNDDNFKVYFQDFLNNLWAEKEKRLLEMKKDEWL